MDTEYYYIQIGEYNDFDFFDIGINTGILGIAGLGSARTSTGESNGDNLTEAQLESLAVGAVFTDHIFGINSFVGGAIDGGNSELDAIVNAIAGTVSHEIGHALSIDHVYQSTSTTETLDPPPIMGTGALDLEVSDRLIAREFSSFAYGEASESSDHIIQVEGSTGTYDIHTDVLGNPFIENALPADFPNGLPEINNVALLTDSVNGTSVPFEFSPGMGLFLVGGTWGIASVRKKSQLKNQLQK